MRKNLEVERVESRPDPALKTGEGILPNTFHKIKAAKVPTDDCEKIFVTACIPCPWIALYVGASECESCRHGKAGSYSEGWVLCNYHSSCQTVNKVEETSLEKKLVEEGLSEETQRLLGYPECCIRSSVPKVNDQ